MSGTGLLALCRVLIRIVLRTALLRNWCGMCRGILDVSQSTLCIAWTQTIHSWLYVNPERFSKFLPQLMPFYAVYDIFASFGPYQTAHLCIVLPSVSFGWLCCCLQVFISSCWDLSNITLTSYTYRGGIYQLISAYHLFSLLSPANLRGLCLLLCLQAFISNWLDLSNLLWHLTLYQRRHLSAYQCLSFFQSSVAG